MTKVTARFVRERAEGRCEYCLIPEISGLHELEVDHIIAEKHSGPTELTNLALCCVWCNRFKGPNLSGLDPQTRIITRLFDPRSDLWDVNFRYEDAVLIGLTSIGRATIFALNINLRARIEGRAALIAARLF
jgi:hypothetical protein